MEDFSINNISKRIYFSKTKSYFDEVARSYYSKNYRSAIVMLYSVLICDLVYKLQELKDRFNDENAIKIIEEIEEYQNKHPSNPDWEKKLIDMIKDRTDLLKASDYSNILMLQKHRHLCSHPILEDNYDLYQPNEETTLSHIRNISEGVFINPPLLTKKVINSLLYDLESIKDLFINEEDELLERYLDSKYLKHASFSITKTIFRSLWKIVYKLKNEESEKNRVINSKAVRVLYRKNQQLLFESIKEEPGYYSDISYGRPIYFIIGLISQHNEIYSILNESARILIQQSAEEDRINKSMAWFLFPRLTDHLKWLKEEEEKETFRSIHLNTIRSIYQTYIEAGLKNELFDFLIWLYGRSKSVVISNNRFSFINYILPKLDKEKLILVLDAIESNVYNQNDNLLIVKRRADLILGSDFDYSGYPNFIKLLI